MFLLQMNQTDKDSFIKIRFTQFDRFSQFNLNSNICILLTIYFNINYFGFLSVKALKFEPFAKIVSNIHICFILFAFSLKITSESIKSIIFKNFTTLYGKTNRCFLRKTHRCTTTKFFFSRSLHSSMNI